MVVLSLFDGMSCGRIALARLGITPTAYYASEINKQAIKVSKDNWQDIIHIGDVTKLSYKDGVLYTEVGEFYIGKVDLLMGGSPCQDFSFANPTGKGLDGNRSSLFYHYLRLKEEIEPINFLLENVKMKTSSKLQLDKYLGVEGVEINSKLFSFQSRPRIYWTNLTIPSAEDKQISFQDFKTREVNVLDVYLVNKTPSRIKMWGSGLGTNSHTTGCLNVTNRDKVACLTLSQDRCPNSGLVAHGDFCRYLTREELEAAQTVPIGYTKSVSYNQAQAVLGNGWTVDVIVHILGDLKKHNG